ncbi:PEP-CTERM sorting domain-containing protein [Aeoliella mucimassa]|uniref:Ice-binding protein C-terminal domain-containing protein n=1 Tax=Aeoliella mucimassa TaxID=2527972 RepID=A0A518APF6_9BACT|nr:PEP-CTERM sorting domain-containing protein [Aeoliella mucimassa]QDU56605.1 hypothetical protein Pan181_28150 [Aeoliella mucimassa]
MKSTSRYLFLLFTAVTLAAAAPASADLVAADDFDDADATLLDGKAADVGGNWRVTQGGDSLAVQGGALDTTGGGRTAYLDFAEGKVLGAGELLTMEVTTLSPSGNNFFSGGYAGFSFFQGDDGSEVMFIGDTGGGEFWGIDQAVVGSTTLSSNNDPEATAVFTYAFDSGDYSLSIDGVTELSGTGTPNLAVDRFRFVNGNGGDLIMDSLSVDISTQVPEPASVCLLAVAAAGLAFAAKRRAA